MKLTNTKNKSRSFVGRIKCLVRGSVACVILAVGTHANATILLDPTTNTLGSTFGTTVVGPGGKTLSWVLGTCGDCNPAGVDVYELTPVDPGSNRALAESEIEAITGDDLSFLYKFDGAKSGPFSSSYDTSFLNTPADPQDALIEWLGGSFIGNAAWLEVKDGNQSPYNYLFDISGWDGKMNIELSNFWPGNGAISYVAIWGNGARVPEPSVFFLLGLGLVALGFAHRKKRS